MHCLRRGAKFGAPKRNDKKLIGNTSRNASSENLNVLDHLLNTIHKNDMKDAEVDTELLKTGDKMFLEPEKYREQELVDAIIDAIIYEKKDRDRLKKDPLVRLLIPNPPGNYDFTIVTAMGVITDGKAGTELEDAFERIEEQRGVKTIRSDVATARSLEFNASKIIEAIESAQELNVPYGLIGYSQGCANVLMAENLLYSGKSTLRFGKIQRNHRN